MNVTVYLRGGASFTMTGLTDFVHRRDKVTRELVGYEAVWDTPTDKHANRSAPYLRVEEVAAFVREPESPETQLLAVGTDLDTPADPEFCVACDTQLVRETVEIGIPTWDTTHPQRAQLVGDPVCNNVGCDLYRRPQPTEDTPGA
jgi:hypothetical protein